MARKPFYLTTELPKTLLLGIQAPYNRITNIDAYFDEFKNLVKANRGHYDKEQYIKVRTIDPAFFITKGKLNELVTFAKEHNIQEVIISEAITARQERNLSDIFDCNVIDRTHLILDIFEKAAHSAEGKKQVAIAQLKYQKSRVAGKGIEMGQQTGIFGTRGPGETAKEKELRHINQQIHKFKKDLDQLQKTRDIQRKRRLDSGELQIALIGYTNAGKSTILNAVAKSDVLAQDKLFATLDTTTRSLWIGPKKIGLISDTVGFIQQLPHQLIQAFKSTLSELQYADLLLQVVDLSDANWESHIQVVHDILDELEIHKEMLYIFNKADKIADTQELLPQLESYQPHIIISSRSKETMKPLFDFLAQYKQH